jgi:hypothetical protein
MKKLISLLAVCASVQTTFAQNYTLAQTEPDENPTRNPIVEAIESAAYQRLDVVMLGDSNQLFGGSGWDHGWNVGLNSIHQMYATGIVSMGENNGAGAGVGYGYSALSNASAGVFSYPPNPNWSPMQSIRLDQGTSYVTVGLNIWPNSPIGQNEGLRFVYRYSLFNFGDGRFQTGIHSPVAPYGPLQRFYPRSTLTSGPVLSGLAYDDLYPGSGSGGAHFRMSSGSIRGPFEGAWIRAENPTRTSGFSVHTWYGYGGMSARDMAEALSSKNLDKLSQDINDFTLLQQPNSYTIFRINTGLNDRNETITSILNNYRGDSKEAYAENVLFVIKRIRDAWIYSGRNAEKIVFVVSMSHKISTPNDLELVSYESKLSEIAQNAGNTFTVKISDLATQEEMNQWYIQPTDKLHMKQVGYETLAAREILFLRSLP